MDFRLLGELEVEADGRLLRLGGRKERALLALLLLRAHEFVSRDVLIDRLWERPPSGAAHALAARISALRTTLKQACDQELLLTRPGGYLLSIDPEQVDVHRVERLLAEGRAQLAAGEPARADQLLSAALACWRGDALADVAFEPVALAEAGRLEELRLSAIEERADARLALGRHTEVVAELEPLVEREPLRERLRARLMLALYREGRQADALAVYQDTRRRLVDELGIEPSRELEQLQRAILRHASELDPPSQPDTKMLSLTAEPPAGFTPAAAQEQRKVVTVVSCDVSESALLVGGQLDPEALRAVLTSYFQRIRVIAERYGGTVEGLIGDAVTAVFGAPVVHGDDALRGVQAAIEMRAALAALGAEARIGVETGEVVTGAEGRLAIGEAVEVAARLHRAAQSGEVLIGDATLALVAGAVETERVQPPTPKGKAEPAPAYRLVRVREASVRGHEPRFVGRRQELRLLRRAWQRVQAERSCELTTIVGDAGIGKSRLVDEFLRHLEARVVHGRCLPYSEGITYWPAAEAVQQLRVLPPDKAAADAIRSMLGETEVVASAEEIAWAVRKTFEHVAGERPLVVVFDDIHWGEETFLDLIEHVALLSSGAPILLLCMARPELIEHRFAWPVALRLEPLPDDEVERLIPEHISGELRTRIARAAGGNPLFIAEMLAMVGEDEVVVPPTLQALLAARLDQLESSERSVLQRGAVEGEIFHRGAVQALAPDEPALMRHLAALVRKELIKPCAPQLPGEDGFRFRHLLMRDAAYDTLPKATRATLHERLAAWLEEHGAALVELDQILGYHLEQAVRYRTEVRLPDDGELQAGARERLAIAGRRASAREDYPAAVGLLERAAALTSAAALDLSLELDLVDALFWARAGEQAIRRAGSIAERAAAAGDRISERCGRIQEGIVRIFLGSEGAAQQLAALIEQALPEFEDAADDLALSLAYRALGQVRGFRGQMDGLFEAYERAAAHAARAGLADRFVHWRHTGLFYGTAPVSTLLAWEDKLDEQERRKPTLRCCHGWLLAMLGRTDEALTLLADARAELAERGADLMLAVTAEPGVGIELLAGDAAAAVGIGEESCRLLDELGQYSVLSQYCGLLGRAYCELGRLEEADALATRAAALASSDDVSVQMLWRQARAKVLARRGEHAQAETLARDAVAIAETTEMLNAQADAYADLADVLSLAGRSHEAANALDQALTRYERKENLVMAERVRGRLAEMTVQQPRRVPV